MSNPTNQQMREWFNNCTPAAKAKYSWLGILLDRVLKVETVVDKIRYAGSEEMNTFHTMDLLELFDADSGDLK